MSSDIGTPRDMERERTQRDAVRAGFVETAAGWVRVSAITRIEEPDPAGTEGSFVAVAGEDDTIYCPLTPAQLLRAIVAVQGRDIS